MVANNGVPAAAAGRISLDAGMTVNRMGFGAMRLTGPGIWGEPSDPEECRRVLRCALELGIDFIDTADSYGPEVSERLIAETLHPCPAGLVIATKGGQLRPGPGQWVPDGRPKHLRMALEGSLRRLRVDQIDLYQLHRPDPRVPYEESLGVLVEAEWLPSGALRPCSLPWHGSSPVPRRRCPFQARRRRATWKRTAQPLPST